MSRTLRYGLFLVVVITVVNASFSLLFRVVARNLPESQGLRVLAVLLASLLSAILIALLVISTAPALRDWLMTLRRLIRLESINHPLLVKLSSEAPGTYHHSLLVANVASRAAKAVGTDSRTTRIAGYFHDIGKLANPFFFIENQSGKNPHNELDDPVKSAEIIINHVKEGIKLAKEYGLPKEIADVIPQHHGTLVIKYFYDKAREKGLNAAIKNFRYPGPRPLSREAALLMLADNAEAKIRGLPDKNRQTIKEAVDEAIAERFQEKQLVYTGFTDADYEKIRASFLESFLSMHHRRLPLQKRLNS